MPPAPLLRLLCGSAALLLLPAEVGSQPSEGAAAAAGCEYQRNPGHYRESGCLTTPGIGCPNAALPTNGNIECFTTTALSEIEARCDSHPDCVGFSFTHGDGTPQSTGTGCLKNNYNIKEWCDTPSDKHVLCKTGVYDGCAPPPRPPSRAQAAGPLSESSRPTGTTRGGTRPASA